MLFILDYKTLICVQEQKTLNTQTYQKQQNYANKKTKQSKPDEELDKKTKSYEDKIKKPEKGKQIRGKLEKNQISY